MTTQDRMTEYAVHTAHWTQLTTAEMAAPMRHAGPAGRRAGAAAAAAPGETGEAGGVGPSG